MTKTDTATVTVTVTMEIENPDVIIGTETWLNFHIPTCEFFPPSHSVFWKDRPDGYGGVLVAVKDLTCQELGDLSSYSELIWAKISLANKKHVYVGAFYNPNSSLEALNGLDSSLSKLQKKPANSSILLCGDFNLGGDICCGSNTIAMDSQYSAACEKLLYLCCTYNLNQVVKDPTRDGKILDLFFLSNSTPTTATEVQPGFGDHDIVRIETLLTPRRPRPPKRKVFPVFHWNFKFGSSFL